MELLNKGWQEQRDVHKRYRDGPQFTHNVITNVLEAEGFPGARELRKQSRASRPVPQISERHHCLPKLLHKFRILSAVYDSYLVGDLIH